MNEKVKSCPFCGCPKVYLNRSNVNACWVSCENCGAEACSHKDRKEAIKNWNMRRKVKAAKIVDDDEINGNFNP